MSKPTENTSADSHHDSKKYPLSPEERAAGRARVAELIGRLIYKQWCKERLDLETDHKPNSK